MSAFSKPRRSTRRRDTETARRSIAKGLATLGVLGVLLYVGLTSYSGVPGKSYLTIYADVPAVGNLIGHDPVRIGGVRVGQVQRLGIGRDGHPRVQLQLESGVDIPADTDVKVRSNGLLGARYVQLIPGTSTRNLDDEGVLRGQPDALSLGVPDTLDTLDAATRKGLGETVDGLGTGLLGHGESLNESLRLVAGAAPRFTAIMDAVLSRPGAAERLVPGLDALVGALDRSRTDIAALLAPADKALRPFVDQRAALRATLDDAPPALASATYGLGRGRRLLTSARALTRSVNETLPAVPRGLRAATKLLRESPPSLDRATALLKAADPTVPAALKLTRALSPNLKPLDTLFSDLEPIAEYVGPRGCDIENFGVVMRSMTGFGGVGTGPLGPSMEFRAQLVAAPEALGPLSNALPAKKDAYSEPCKYLSKPYPYVAAGGAGR